MKSPRKSMWGHGCGRLRNEDNDMKRILIQQFPLDPETL